MNIQRDYIKWIERMTVGLKTAAIRFFIGLVGCEIKEIKANGCQLFF